MAMVKQDLRTGISINSSPADVFRVLTNFQCYADWNPWLKDVTNIAGEAKVGDLIGGKFNVGGLFELKLTYRVGRMRAPDTMFWREQSWFNSLFSIRREYQILTKSGGAAIYSVGVRIKGPLASVVKSFGGRFIRRALKIEATALKRYCEEYYPLNTNLSAKNVARESREHRVQRRASKKSGDA